jgi:hypothetical protein
MSNKRKASAPGVDMEHIVGGNRLVADMAQIEIYDSPNGLSPNQQ